MKSLFAIYAYRGEQGYALYHVFDEEGGLDFESLLQFVEGHPGLVMNPRYFPYLVGFESLDQVKTLAFELCREREADRVVLLTPQDYNEVIEEHSHPEPFFQALASRGESMENLEERSSKGGLLGKIFR